MRTRFSTAALIIAAGLAAAPALAADKVGEATRLILYAYQTPADDARAPLYRLDPVFKDATVETVADGGTEITFIDRSKLTLGPESAVVIDDFVYSGSGTGDGAAIDVAKGFFRFVSGEMPDDNVKIGIPTATIGVRGTTINGGTFADGSAVVNCIEGLCRVASRTAQQIVDLAGFQYVLISASGELGVVQDGVFKLGEPTVDDGIALGDGGDGGEQGGNGSGGTQIPD